MPISYSLNENINLIYFRYSNRIVVSDINATYPAVFEAIADWDTAEEIADLSQVEAFDMPIQSIKDTAERIAMRRSNLNLKGRKVIVAPDDVTFGLARVYSAHAAFVGPFDVQVVRTLPEALLQLNLSSETLCPMMIAAE